ncbi:hypothetical protein [Streptomyces paromomycinus]|uniref:Serine/threonine protein kinase n=1 Tax=Streptomyces paromomycinus TaxID=92743 RepID=A0A401W4Q2_STREY|nr:hypothetical protein [Streptomyces paromomycinus]GCD44299.1 hypothetical protein GKJPGBOP_03995 [Streptomyces paromomycinus]
MERAPNLRMIALASTVALAVALPLAAATAGPAESDRSAADDSASATHPDAGVPVGTRASAAPGPDAAPVPSRGAHTVPRTGAPADSRTEPRSGPRTAADGRRTTRCGPELAAPEGVEAQTCVLTEGGLTWGRTYYRNTSGKPLRAVLSLLRPDGRTVQAHCDLPAGDEPAICETPREATVGGDRAPYTAVAEVADARGERKLLRSGSNAAPGSAGSDQ